eukprot:NODE_7047_length_797_cov_417.925816_g6808_i0.p1 GENE.NODE_7047_length_797_cov_417.925816_g6808_i0~~NODE_7047_length_797_cov_417.925816_g6808_i0.p1  ORF type:complete len:156 (-),score=29.07 NODE_7047_length_797_cov_417.925816_g6808_i0:271-738(-)
MASVQVSNVVLMTNPARYTDEYKFYIRFEAIEELNEDLNWKLVYVGSSESEKYDQVLEDVLVGPIARGPNEFLLSAPAPDHSKIPPEHLLGVTVILLICTFKDQEFIRVGYYVNNDYESEEDRENPPETIQIEKVMRNVLVEQPRVTTHSIEWKC